MRRGFAIVLILITVLSTLCGADVVLSCDDFILDDTCMYMGDDGIVWDRYGGEISCTFEIEESGYYDIILSYRPLEGRMDDIELYFYIDGGQMGESFFEIPRIYSYGQIRKDENGDDLRALTWVDSSSVQEHLRPKDGSGAGFVQVHLDKGVHELVIRGRRTSFVLEDVTMHPHSDLQECTGPDSYSGSALIHVEAENISRSTSTTLTSQFDRSSSATSPSDPSHLLLNIAGGTNWNKDGDFIAWDFYVEQEGWYQIGMRFRQNTKTGLASYRRIWIDGQVPCAAFDEVVFPFDGTWQLRTIDEFIHLEAGRHEIRIEVVPGPYSAQMSRLQRIVDDLNGIYRQIIMITSTSPDPDREYDIDREIPGLMDDFVAVRDALVACAQELNVISGETGMSYTTITTLVNQIDSFIRDPESIPDRLSVFKGNITSLSSWIYSVSEQPLDLDWIEFRQAEAGFSDVNGSFIADLVYSIGTLISSFSSEDEDADGALEVWVQAGRDQMQVVNDLVDEFFTPSTGIDVEVSLVQTGIEQAVLAGSGPDVVLFMPYATPVTLAMRNALYPLDSFEDFDETVIGYADEDDLAPYRFEGHCYALPLTETFPMMFYRTDIFQELGIEPPSTWDEFKMVIPIIQRANMEVGLSSAWTTFVTFLMQNGGRLYDEDRTGTMLDTEEAYRAFRDYTRYYSDYSLPLTFDFFNRFRSGEMPLAITDYTEWGRLDYAAGEISGLYSMAPIPSTNGDGSCCVTNAQAAVILGDCDMIEEAWAFLKWFVSVDVQTEYGLRIESLMGPSGRYQTVSDEVMSNLSWLPEELEVLLTQKAEAYAVEQIPGSYYTQRNITSAFRNVVIGGENEREMLDRYGDTIDREIMRKRQELGLGGGS